MSLTPRRFAAPALALLVASALLAPGLVQGPGVAEAKVLSLAVNPGTFSPNGDGLVDSVTAGWIVSPAHDSLRVSIWPEPRDSVRQVPVRRYTFGPGPTGLYRVTWDGRDSAGIALPDSLYRIQVLELTTTGDTVETAAEVTARLDTTPPPEPYFDKGFDGETTTDDAVFLTGVAPGAENVYIYAGGIAVDTVRAASLDGTFEYETTLALGANTFALQSIDRGANLSVLTPAITITFVNTSDIGFLRVTPFESSPNGDGFVDTVRVRVSLDAPTTRLRVEIRASVPPLTGTSVADSANSIVSLYDEPIGAGEHEFFWFGQDSTGTPVADGNWWAFAQAESADAVGNPLPGRRVFTRFLVDNTAPPVPAVDASTTTQTTRNLVTLQGTTPGADSVYVARGGSNVARPAGPRWTTTANLLLGANSFTFRGVDRAGNRSAFSAPFVVTYSEPIGFHAPERFRATDVFDLNLSKTARAVRIDLYDLRGRRVRTLAVNQLGQRYELPWNVKDDAGNTVGDGPYVARATVTYEDGSSTITTAAVVVAK